jgi:hypothetical protein
MSSRSAYWLTERAGVDRRLLRELLIVSPLPSGLSRVVLCVGPNFLWVSLELATALCGRKCHNTAVHSSVVNVLLQRETVWCRGYCDRVVGWLHRETVWCRGYCDRVVGWLHELWWWKDGTIVIVVVVVVVVIVVVTVVVVVLVVLVVPVVVLYSVLSKYRHEVSGKVVFLQIL